jgi:1-phosphatidylinositol phosphodiesterase
MKNNQLNFFFGIFIMMLLLVNGCKKDETQNPQDPEYELGDDDQNLPYHWKTWMGHVDGSLHLNQITIPGTHESGADKHTSNIHWYNPERPWIICQDFSIPNQLNLGVRWLDIRLNYVADKDELTVHHSSHYLHKNFDDVLGYCIKFLNDHPTETIILMIKQEYSNANKEHFSKRVYDHIKKKGLSSFYLHNSVPKLDDVRGKIYIVRRFENKSGHSPFGVYAYWTNNTNGSFHSYNGIGWYVQDRYDLINEDYLEKVKYVKKTIKYAHEEQYNNVFHLNFVSGYDICTLWTTAEEINPAVDTYIKGVDKDWTNCGVIMINFAGGGDVNSGSRNCVPHLVQHILERNDGVPY